jgi:hypothetical protein
MTLDELQSTLRDLTRGIEHPRVGAALALAEECGEVMRCVLDKEYYGKDVTAQLHGEVGDVLVALCELCDRYSLSLSAAATDAVAKIRTKAPLWRAELGDRLIDLRKRMDG